MTSRSPAVRVPQHLGSDRECTARAAPILASVGSVNRGEQAQFAAWAEARLPVLTDEVCTAVNDRIAFYRHEHVVPSEDLRGSVEYSLRFAIKAIARPEAPLDLRFAEETGRRRAHQGAPLPEVLQVYRIGFAALWSALVEHARRDGPTKTGSALLTTASRILDLTDHHALAVTEAYRTATATLVAAQQRRRSALVEALLTGHPNPDGGPWEAAALLGIPHDGHMVVVVADTLRLAEESLPDIESELAARGLVSGWRLTPAQHLGIVSLHADQRDTVVEVLEATARARVGISPLFESLADAPRALRLAQAALATVPPGDTGVHMFTSSPLAALMACTPQEGQRLVEQVLGPVLGLSPDDRATLLETLAVYLAHQGSAEHAAEHLYCHPNTVRYRLRRLQELTGRSLSNPHGMAELTAATYALQLGPVTGSSSGPRSSG